MSLCQRQRKRCKISLNSRSFTFFMLSRGMRCKRRLRSNCAQAVVFVFVLTLLPLQHEPEVDLSQGAQDLAYAGYFARDDGEDADVRARVVHLL